MVKRLIPNYEFVENMPTALFKEFINIPDGLPHVLMGIVRDVIPDVNLIRWEVYNNHPEFIEMDQEERAITHKMRCENCTLDDEFNFSTDYALHFLSKYPQFKPMIKGVEEVG